MRIFISWSGQKSKKLAEIFRLWIPSVVQAVKPYFSPDDIQKGTRWSNEVSKELEESKVGLIILTPENLSAPWVMFEAGALSKNISASRVCPILFELETTDVEGPLAQFQASKFNKTDIKKLLTTINEALGDDKLNSEVLETAFEVWWPKLEDQVNGVLKEKAGTKKDIRSEKDLLQEILSLTRNIASMRFVPSFKQLDPEPVKELLENFLTFVQDCQGDTSLPEHIEKNIKLLKSSLGYLATRIDHPTTDLGILYKKIIEAIDTLNTPSDIVDDVPFF